MEKVRVLIKRSIRNAEIIIKRNEMGLSQRQLAELVECPIHHICQLEQFKLTESNRESLERIAEFFEVPPEFLCPEWTQVFKDIPKNDEKTIAITKLQLESATRNMLMVESPYSEMVNAEKDEIIKDFIKAMDEILNKKTSTIIKMRLGLDGHKTHTFVEIGKIFKVTRAWVNFIYSRGIDKLKTLYEGGKLSWLNNLNLNSQTRY